MADSKIMSIYLCTTVANGIGINVGCYMFGPLFRVIIRVKVNFTGDSNAAVVRNQSFKFMGPFFALITCTQ